MKTAGPAVKVFSWHSARGTKQNHIKTNVNIASLQAKILIQYEAKEPTTWQWYSVRCHEW